jgi:hypothetical protein
MGFANVNNMLYIAATNTGRYALPLNATHKATWLSCGHLHLRGEKT